MGETLVGGGNAILLLLTGLAVAGALILAFVASRRQRTRSARTFVTGAAILALLYSGGLITASAASREETLAAGDTKWFCGFYLDCHLGLSIARTEVLDGIAGPQGAVRPSGKFHVVTLRLHNSAKNPSLDMLLYKPDARIVDERGERYGRNAAAEAAIGGGTRPAALGEETRVSHEPVHATIVFDLPLNVQQPRLLVSEGWIVGKLIELGLINDENSILHKRVYLALDGTSGTTASLTAE